MTRVLAFCCRIGQKCPLQFFVFSPGHRKFLPGYGHDEFGIDLREISQIDDDRPVNFKKLMYAFDICFQFSDRFIGFQNLTRIEMEK